MAIFALIHAAWHGSWCWERLVPELESRGHRAITPNLPCQDPQAGTAHYAEVVLDELLHIDEELIVVGHSLAGLTIPLVAVARPVSRLVFVCALLPVPGLAWRDQFAADTSMIVSGFGRGLTADEQGCTSWVDEDQAIRTMYADCSEAEAAAAVARLRPQGQAPYEEVCALDSWPAVPSSYVIASDDRVVSPDWGRRATRERLGITTIELEGGHSPFLSRPGQLASVLDEIASGSDQDMSL